MKKSILTTCPNFGGHHTKTNWKTFPPTSEYITVGIESNSYTMFFQHFTDGPLIIRDVENNIIAKLEFGGGDVFYHTYDIEYENIDTQILVGIYLLLEMGTAVSFFEKG